MNLSMLVLKSDELSAFLRPGSSFFHSKLWFALRRGIFGAFLVGYNVGLTGIKLKRYRGCSFFKTL